MSKNWLTAKLGEITTPANRAEGPMPGTTYRQIGVKLWGEGAYERETMDGAETRYTKLFRAEAGDIIVNKIWARNGSVAVVPSSLAGCYGSGEFPMFTPQPNQLDPRWMHWLTKTPDFWAQCDEKSRGTSGKNRIRPEQFLRVEIPLPSLVEQHRIVARIEELSAKIQEARGLRQQAGEERDALVLSALTHLRLPPGSAIKPISSCSTMSTGTTPPSHRADYYGGTIQWYTPGDLEYQQRLGASSRTLSEVALAERKARMFEPGTVLLVAIGGSLGKVGLTHERCSANQQVTGIKFSSDILPEYGFWWMRRLGKELKTAAPQATLPIINQERIGVFEISIPSLEDQRRLVAHLDDLQEKTSALKALQAETAAELNALLPSILDKAFRGEM
jgi:type I restriction enzyme, S subunit